MEPAPAQLRNALRDGGFTEPKFFAQKILEKRDLSRNHDRLLIEVEANNPIIAELEPEGIGGIGVRLIYIHSLELMESRNLITLRKNPRGISASSYVLGKGWLDVAVNQINPGLQPNQTVRLWSCRRPGNAMFYVFVEVVATIESRTRVRGRRR